MLHFIITIAVCGAVLWVASVAVILAFAYAATKGRDRTEPVKNEIQLITEEPTK